MIIFFITLLVLGITLAIFYHRRRVNYKMNVVLPILESMFGTVEYGELNGFDKHRIYDTKLVNNGNTFRSEDYLKAEYKGVTFESADVEITNVTSNGKTTTTITYFKGQWVIVKPKRKIEGRLYIIDRNFYHSDPKGFWIFKDTSLDKELMESVDFNDEFNVYAESGHEAFYVLSPQKLIALLKIHHENVSFYFNNDELHIAIYSRKNMFEPTLFGDKSMEAQKQRVTDSILNVLKYLDLFEVEKEGEI